MVRFLGDRAKGESLPTLRPLLSMPEDPRLPEPVDLALVVDTYHHIPAREAYFARLRASKLAVIDFRMESPIGPPREYRIAPEGVARELGAAGWHRVASHDFLPNQYFLVFAR
jgi:hypothetical protein